MPNNIFIDSTNLEIDKHYYFTVNLQEKIVVTKYIRLTQAVIPFDNYTIDEDNGSFSIGSFNFSIPTGNYDFSSLLAKINAMVTPSLNTFNISLDTLQGSVIIQASFVFSMKFSREFSQMLGFRKTLYTGAAHYIGEQTPILYIPQVVLIDVQEIPDNASAQVSRYDTSFSFLFVNASNPGQNIQYINPGEEDNTIEMTGILRSFSIRLYKNNGNLFKIRSPIQLSFQYE